MAAMISIHPTSTNVTQFETFSLICEGTGNPIPDIIWAHNDSVIDTVQEHVNVMSVIIALQRAHSTLTISMADANTSGLYYCNVTVVGETVRSRSALVFVQGKSHINLPRICAHFLIIM